MDNRPLKVLLLNFSSEGPVSRFDSEFMGARFSITEHRIGWDFKTGQALIQQHDGRVDGIALGGVQKRVSSGKLSLIHPGYSRLIRAAAKTKIYVADNLQAFFANLTIQRVLKEDPHFFAGRKVLFHSALVSHSIRKVLNAGGVFQAADALLVAGIPKLLTQPKQLQIFLKMAGLSRVRPRVYGNKPYVADTLNRWIGEADVFVSFSSLLDRMESYESLRGKILITDYLSPETSRKIADVSPEQVIELIPRTLREGHIGTKSLALTSALLDLTREAENSLQSPEEYMLNWIQNHDFRPNPMQRKTAAKRRCAFIIHPLSQDQLWRIPALKKFKNAPRRIKDAIEYSVARLPIQHYGTIQGIKSEHNGQEVICDLYVIPGTPKQLLAMDEQFVYKRLIAGCELAQERGATLIGLGAYTKIVGDAGVSVARGSPIPVTTGNSFSTSATLWAARDMVERLGVISPEREGNRFKSKVVILGATGSIGRVSSLLVSLVFNEVILVATQLDKLMELRQEILELSPGVRVRVSTNPNAEISDADLIVTATSNHSGTPLLDIERVKPGTVICDCSRPFDVGPEEAAKRPDILVIESGEVLLPGDLRIDCDIGLPKPSVYACLAETALLCMEGRNESFSLSRQLSMNKVKEIYRVALKHGARLSEIRGPLGLITDEQIVKCRELARERLKTWQTTPRRKNEATLEKLPSVTVPEVPVVPAMPVVPVPLTASPEAVQALMQDHAKKTSSIVQE